MGEVFECPEASTPTKMSGHANRMVSSLPERTVLWRLGQTQQKGAVASVLSPKTGRLTIQSCQGNAMSKTQYVMVSRRDSRFRLATDVARVSAKYPYFEVEAEVDLNVTSIAVNLSTITSYVGELPKKALTPLASATAKQRIFAALTLWIFISVLQCRAFVPATCTCK